MRFLFLIQVLVFLFSGCSSNPISRNFKEESLSQDISDKYFKNHKSMRPLKISKHLQENVQKWIDVFSGKFKPGFTQYLENGLPYKEMVISILDEYGLPEELYYLPVIESGYQMTARSHMGAVGPWQFIAVTGKNYGLKVDRYVDERRNIEKATRAAARHLRDLHNIFGSWELALASYNAGVRRITGVIMRGKKREFSKLIDLDVLPNETEDYIPKFMAAVLIGKHPEQYGFTLNQYASAWEGTQKTNVPGGLSFKKISKMTGVSLSLLKTLNPEFKRNYIPSSIKETELRVPAQYISSFENKRGDLQKIAKKNSRRTRRSIVGKTYRVKRGDTLSRIAARNKISLSKLLRMNGLSRRHKIYPGQKLSIGGRFYTVKKGDNLTLIAKRVRRSVRHLKRLNGFKGSRIYPGQKIRI